MRIPYLLLTHPHGLGTTNAQDGGDGQSRRGRKLRRTSVRVGLLQPDKYAVLYTVYKITNLINEKAYIGCHATANLDDGYMGSGKLIQQAIRKHGLHNFSKKILAIYEAPEPMFALEAQLVTEEVVASPLYYNLKVGGFGGFSEPCDDLGRKTHRLIAQKRIDDPDYDRRYRAKLRKMSDAARVDGRNRRGGGKAHTEESRRKISATMTGRGTGAENSQFGSRWMSHPEKGCKKTKPTEFENYLQNGWYFGRKVSRDGAQG